MVEKVRMAAFFEDNVTNDILYPEDCQICHLCRMYCPVDAITISPDKSIPVIVSWG